MEFFTPEKRFESALYGVSQSVARVLFCLDSSVKARVQEIRLRAEKPLALTIDNDCFYVTKAAQIVQKPNDSLHHNLLTNC